MASSRSARRTWGWGAVIVLAAGILATPAGADPPAPLSYVALGDSYASGEGLTPFVDAACHRSVRSHPFLVERPGQSTPIATDADLATTFQSLACSGATIADVRANQLGAVTTDTDLVTVSVGGNDAGFATVLEQCFSGTCSMDLGTLDALVDPLTALYQDLGATGATVVATTYPQLFESPTPCGSILVGFPPFLFTLTMSQTEWNNARAYNARMNDVVEVAARRAGVHLVDVEASFAGHGLCTSVPWINNVIQTDLLGNVDPASFHPTAEGQRQYAVAVNAALDALVAGGTPTNPDTGLPQNPAADPTAAVGAPAPTTATLTVTPVTCGTTSTAPGEAVRLTASGFAPASAVRSALLVNGVEVAAVNGAAAGNGVATSTLTVPASLGRVTVPVTFTSTGVNPAFFAHTATAPFVVDFFLVACDRVAPTITATTPFDGQTVIKGAAINAAFTCADDRLVVASCTGTTGSGQPLDTATVGPKTFTISATDPAGNTATRSVNYGVRYNASFGYTEGPTHQFAGFQFTTTIRLRDAAGVASVDPANITSTSATFGACSNPTTSPVTAGSTVTATTSALTYKLKLIQVPIGQCFRVTLHLDDGTTHVLNFKRVDQVVL